MNEGRATNRLARLLRGSVLMPSGQRHNLLIQNVSRHGIGGRFTGQRLAAGDAVTVEIANIGTFRGRVQWQSETRIGLCLDDELDVEDIRFRNGKLIDGKGEGYQVPHRAMPVRSTWRPGFGKDSSGRDK